MTADLGRIVRESPRVLYRGFGKVNEARRDRRDERRRKAEEKSELELSEASHRGRSPPARVVSEEAPGDSLAVREALEEIDLGAPPAFDLAPRPAPAPDDPEAAWWAAV